MPIPTPTSFEKKGGKKGQNKFISRCMDTLNKDYPDSKQRAAICFKSYRDSKKKSSGTFDHLETEKIEIID